MLTSFIETSRARRAEIGRGVSRSGGAVDRGRHRLAAGALVASLAFVPAVAMAAELTANRGGSIDLGHVRGVAYFTELGDALEVVATLAPEEGGQPIRVVARLADGQSLLLSVPAGVGEAAREIELVRVGGRVVLRKPEAGL